MKRVLLIDCYVDAQGGADNFLPALAGVEAHVTRPAHGAAMPAAGDFAALVITGSAASVVIDVPPWVDAVLGAIRAAAAADRPILGVCFGHQAIAHALVDPGPVRLSPTPEVGWYDVEVTGSDPLLAGLESGFRTFVSHLDEVTTGPPDAMRVLARTERCANHAFRLGDAAIWGVQFHAEMGSREARALVRSKAEKRPDLGLDPDAVMARERDARPVFHRLVANFLAHL